MFLEVAAFRHTPGSFLDRAVVASCAVSVARCVQVQVRINTDKSTSGTAGQIPLCHCTFVVIFSEIQSDCIFSLGKLIPRGICSKICSQGWSTSPVKTC